MRFKYNTKAVIVVLISLVGMLAFDAHCQQKELPQKAQTLKEKYIPTRFPLYQINDYQYMHEIAHLLKESLKGSGIKHEYIYTNTDLTSYYWNFHTGFNNFTSNSSFSLMIIRNEAIDPINDKENIYCFDVDGLKFYSNDFEKGLLIRKSDKTFNGKLQNYITPIGVYPEFFKFKIEDGKVVSALYFHECETSTEPIFDGTTRVYDMIEKKFKTLYYYAWE